MFINGLVSIGVNSWKLPREPTQPKNVHGGYSETVLAGALLAVAKSDEANVEDVPAPGVNDGDVTVEVDSEDRELEFTTGDIVEVDD
jgi:hypothetical protein